MRGMRASAAELPQQADDAVTRGISSSLQQSVSVIPSAWGKTAQFLRHDLA